MTEQEWRTCTDQRPMLDFLHHRATERKLRLFACACCRRAWNLLPEPCRHAVLVSERSADGEATNRDRAIAARLCEASGASYAVKAAMSCLYRKAFSAALQTAAISPAAFAEPLWAVSYDRYMAALSREFSRIPPLLRCIFGIPFRPINVDPAWRTPQVVSLAQEIYDNHAFDRLPDLAEALARVGCDNADILAHCRGPGPHVRGCWVVDLILSKE